MDRHSFDWLIRWDGDRYTVYRSGDPWMQFRTLAAAVRRFPYARIEAHHEA